jgi:16S rRNA (guanine1207-N2)-methyltransferase
LLEAHPNAKAGYEVLPSTVGWDIVLLTIPKERRYSRTLLLAAWGALKLGGLLLLSGPTRKGAKAVINDAGRLFGKATVIGYRGHQRIGACIRSNPLPHPLPDEFQQTGIAPSTIHTIVVQGPNRSLVLETHPGIFSWVSIDEGTDLLLNHLDIQPGSRVWDVGCGYGVIGLTAAMAGAGWVLMSDVNLLGVDYTKRNAARNNFTDRVHVFPADGLALPTESSLLSDLDSPPLFDWIVSNPAFHQGHQVNQSMADGIITCASHFLAPKGQMLIVANRFLNYDRSMQPYFKQVTRLVETNKFHLLMASNV